MSGVSYFADTNCFIYLLNENPLLRSFAEYHWAYSFITEIELLSKNTLTVPDEQLIRQMLATCQKTAYSELISEHTIMIRRNYKLKLPDALIAASALSLNIPLLTADTQFAKVKEIDCFILEL